MHQTQDKKAHIVYFNSTPLSPSSTTSQDEQRQDTIKVTPIDDSIIPRDQLMNHDIEGDGNCLFYSLTNQMQQISKWSTMTNDEIRQDSTSSLNTNMTITVHVGDSMPIYQLAPTVTTD
jgi:hypothetical protein